jgi:hypothetical protein
MDIAALQLHPFRNCEGWERVLGAELVTMGMRRCMSAMRYWYSPCR